MVYAYIVLNENTLGIYRHQNYLHLLLNLIKYQITLKHQKLVMILVPVLTSNDCKGIINK